MLPALNQPNMATVAYLADRTADELARQRAILRARKYYDGEQFVKLTDRLREFLKDSAGEDWNFLRLNICHTVVNAVLERLLVRSFVCEDDRARELFWQWWQRNRMDVLADDAHEMTIRDGEAFILVGWNNEERRPTFTPHPRYIAADLSLRKDTTVALLSGLPSQDSGWGIRAYYPDDDDNQPMLYATKRWTERRLVNGGWRTRVRLTVYHPDRIEKYAVRGDGLDEIRDEGDPDWPIPWVDRTGRPLGIPVIHMKNAGLKAEAWEAIPLQNALNKALIDLVQASDLTAFRVFAAFGFFPTTDGKEPKTDKSNWWKAEPGSVVGSAKSDGSFSAIDGADLNNQIAPVNQLIFWAAMVTDTPVSRFVATAQVAAAATLKAQERPLVKKVEKRQSLLGNAWEDCMALARRLHNTYGPAPQLDEAALISAQWEPAETRDPAAEIAALGEKRERLGIPLLQIWREAGYTEEEIEAMQQMPEYQARVALMSLGAQNGE